MKKRMLGLFLLGISCLIGHADDYDTYSDTWVCNDGLGRVVASRDNGITRTKVDSIVKVGMFYYIWHGQHGAEIKDITRLLETNPENPSWGGVNQFHWGGKPVLGYYQGGDKFIVARHMEMLMDAGVDFYFFDVTNAFTYDNNVKVVMAEIDRRAALGLKTPKLVFCTHASTPTVVKNLYNTFYNKSSNDKYWFYWNGKPLILVNESEAASIDATIASHFTIRYSWAWQIGENRWSWLANYPQGYGYSKETGSRIYEQISVSVAQHATSKIGKSYHNGKQPAYDKYGLCKETPKGYYFQEQWNRAIAAHPKVVMVTQWNEWMAQRFLIQNTGEYGNVRPGATAKVGESFFVDVYNQEFCRDIEPSSESLIRDNYYLQLVSNMRRFKGAREIPVPTVSKTIDLDGDFSQWEEVTPEFRDEPRDCYYTSATAQALECRRRKSNDFVKAKVTKDLDSLYFYVATKDNIVTTNYQNIATRWMSLLLNTDGDYTNGWEGYDYLVANKEGQQWLYSYNNINKEWEEIRAMKFTFSGKELMLAIPKNLVGMKDDGDFDFKWIDNIEKSSTEILDFIVNGDVAPNGRFNYRFKGSKLTSTNIKGVAASTAQWNVRVSGRTATFDIKTKVTGKLYLAVYDLAGKKAASIQAPNTSAGVCSKSVVLAPGTYVVQCKVGQRKVGTAKFIVKAE